jgi:DNA repair protein RAD57
LIATRLELLLILDSAAGKTQFLLTLLLSVQLSTPLSKGKSAIYISTEAPLQTTRLSQILNTHPKLSGLPAPDQPSLSRIQSTHIHDVEAQEHILRYQVPVAVQKQDIGLLIVDSIAANYRAEFDKTKARKGAASFAKRNNQLSQLGSLLRDIARTYNVAVVVANQVADRFTTAESSSQAVRVSQSTQRSRRESPPQSRGNDTAQFSSNIPVEPSAGPQLLSTDDPLALDHQMRFFTGWGDDPTAENFKTPSLGLTWTNQLATRIALLKEPIYENRVYRPGEDRNIAGWKRTAKIVFSAWCSEGSVDFEIWEGGIKGVERLRVS